MSYAPKHLKLWNCGGEFASGWDSCSNYAGDRFDDRYVVLTRTRDSEILGNVNFAVALERLGGERVHEENCKACRGMGRQEQIEEDHFADPCKAPGCVDGIITTQLVQIVRIGHWACGWLEHLMVHKSADDATLEKADDIVEELRSYPVLDDDRYSAAQDEAVYNYWETSMSLKDRVEACREAGASIFHARPKRGIPEKCYDDIRESCP